MSTFTGGALKLKGGLKPTGIKKKKKKSSTTTELVAVDGAAGKELAGGKAVQEGEGASAPLAVEDRRTAAEKAADAHALKYEEARIRKAAAKSHRERIAEMNEKLANLTEHHDIFRISYTA
ncbi:FAM32A-like protein [Auxenochlorella protothecoides]|uniref:FAM32A-like protein n=1 Tax=Auxenochlorella protothecoides TaxID=3075 RepID=A0A087SDS9_AUXPR|nr:FAM32A-like protein [Auxenochlorella protothecoides]KFM23883.1 FAM32A-like protein [Auxenochlorella protothecoides]RMZ54764.1 hypothetical protein APUTEX25_000281 [Auxenochlorella protothecoides]|eukprot:RMZ54764.1 hypothetical protein APUTEX25_000281 [Auxenochlorella protothecoides]